MRVLPIFGSSRLRDHRASRSNTTHKIYPSIRSIAVRPLEIHQVHESCAYGDGVTNGMFFIQGLLQQAGYNSEIYCHNIDARLVDRIRPASSYVDRRDNLLLFHCSAGTEHNQWIVEQTGPRI